MTALERLYAEEWPDGTFGGPRPQPATHSPAEPAPSRLDVIARRRAELLADLRTRKAA